MPDPDLKIRGGKGAPSSRPFDKRGGGGLQKKLFSALRASVWSKNKGGWAGPPGPSLGSATVPEKYYTLLTSKYRRNL